MKNFVVALASTLLFAACAKKEGAPPADPAPEATMARTLTFPTASSLNADTTYAQPAMAGQGLLDNDRLRLSFAPLAGRDFIRFTVPIAALAPGLSGSYKLLDQRHSAGAVAETFYTFGVARNLASTGSFLVSGAEHATRGQLLVTSYDASRRLLSGSFEMAIDNIQNLTDKFSVPNAPPLCNLRERVLSPT